MVWEEEEEEQLSQSRGVAGKGYKSSQVGRREIEGELVTPSHASPASQGHRNPIGCPGSTSRDQMGRKTVIGYPTLIKFVCHGEFGPLMITPSLLHFISCDADLVAVQMMIMWRCNHEKRGSSRMRDFIGQWFKPRNRRRTFPHCSATLAYAGPVGCTGRVPEQGPEKQTSTFICNAVT